MLGRIIDDIVLIVFCGMIAFAVIGLVMGYSSIFEMFAE